MTERIFREDTVQIDHQNYVENTDPIFGSITVFKDVVIASEIIQVYEDGNAYKPADELEKAFWTWSNRWAISGDHPVTGIISKRGDVHGRTVNVRFVKNLKDHKTDRPNRRGILVDLQVFNNKVSPEVLQAMKSGEKSDVSIGFFFTMDAVPGTIEEDGHPLNGQSYDYIQRDFMGEHTAFGLDKGRCPMPYCGIGADTMMEQFTGDPFAKWKTMTACIKEIMKENPDYTKEQAAATCTEIEKKSKAKKDLFTITLENMRKELDMTLSKLSDIEDAGKPKTEAERAMTHFKISKEKWEKMSKKERAKKISELPKRGEGLKKDETEPIIDETMSDEDLSGLFEFYSLSQANWDAFTEEVHAFFKSLYAEQKKPDEVLDVTDVVDDCPDCEDDEEEIKRLATDLSLEDIDKKLKELKTARERLREQVRVLDEKLYQEPDTEKKRKAKIREERGELWDRLDDLYDEIRAYTQAKTLKITQSALVDKDEQDDYDEFIAPHLAEDAVMTYAQKKALPDSAYAYIEAGCKKVDGKTAQKCRHLPIHDEAHVKAALAALGGARTGKVPSYASKAKGKVCAAAKKFKIESEVCGTKKKKKDVTPFDVEASQKVTERTKEKLKELDIK